MKNRVSFKEGMWFSIPLDLPFVGVIARSNPRGFVALVYIFSGDALAPRADVRPTDAVRVMRVSDLYLRSGRWKVIGESAEWDRRKWPVPAFVRKDPLRADRRWRVEYDDDDLLVERTRDAGGSVEGLDDDGLYGAEAAEIRLSQL